MTSLPSGTYAKQLGLVIDLNACVGCQACAVACKEWNTGGFVGPLSDKNPYQADQTGAWLNRIHGYEADGVNGEPGQTVYFPRSCLHCKDAPCVTVCPTGASHKRPEDGIVLVDEDRCMGCGLCAWACAYGAREMDPADGVMKKCTLCVDRIYNDTLDPDDRQPACVAACPTTARHFGDLADPQSQVSQLVAARDGFDLMPEQGCSPTNKYLPVRKSRAPVRAADSEEAEADPSADGFFGWLDRVLSA